MMRNVLLLLVCILPSCGAIKSYVQEEVTTWAKTDGKDIVEEQATKIVKEKAPELLKVVDTNKDGKIQVEEIRGIQLNDPLLWGVLLNTLVNVFGLRRNQGQIDELYDRTHTPVAKS